MLIARVPKQASPAALITVFSPDMKLHYFALYSETDAMQLAIAAGHRMTAVQYSGDSIEIHTLEDYLCATALVLGDKFTSADSRLKNSILKSRSYIYNSTLVNSSLERAIVIDSQIKNRKIKNKVVFRNNEYKISVGNKL